MKRVLVQQELNTLFVYTDGIITNKIQRNPRALKGSVVGSIKGVKGNQYLYVRIHKVDYRLHRVIWTMHYGNIPDGYIVDHIDRNRLNNKINNLRAIPSGDNNKNMSIRSDNKTGKAGVRKRKNKKRDTWVVETDVNKKRIYLGTFYSLDEAIEAKLIAETKYNFSEGHGE